MKTKSAVALVLFPAIAAFLTCANLPNQGGTDTGNGHITAMLYNPNGTPAAHAKVMFYPVNYNPHTGGLGKTATAATVDSTTTDANGNYTATLDTGTYNILASGSGNLAYQDSIAVTMNRDTVKPPPDTLHTPGTIQGIVQLQPGDDARTVFILFMGTHTFTMPGDSVGNFTSDDMAAGHYSVRIITTTPNYKELDTNLSVIAGTVNVLPAPIVLQYTGIPIPQGLRIVYDTLKQIVTLIWNKPTNGSAVQSYTIYRKRSDSASFVSIKGGVTDTVYSDSTGVQDMTYEYRVAVVDTNASEGTKSVGDTIVITGIFRLKNKIVNSSIIDPRGIVVDSNAIISVEDFNASNIIKMDTNGVVLKTVNLRDSSNNLILGLRALTVDENGNYYVASDNSGIFWLNNTGAFLAKFDSIDYGYGIALSDSFAYVAFSHAIRKFTRNGHFIAQWANVETSPGYVRSPGGIVLSGDSVFVFDEINSQVQIYSKDGIFLSAWGIQGENDGQFTQGVSKIVIDARGRLIVAQQTFTKGLRVQFFTKSGQYLGKFLAGVINEYPMGIAIDKNNTLYLTIEDIGTSASNISIFKKTSGF